MALTKADIVANLAKNADVTQAQAGAVLDAFINLFKTSVKNDGEFGIVGLFKAEVKDTAAREGRNPHTGAAISIPAGKTVRIKAGANLKDLVK